MKSKRTEGWSRRDFMRGLTLAGTADLVGLCPGRADADPPPETTRLRLAEIANICIAPQLVAKELLHGEGFTDVQYVKAEADPHELFLSGEVTIGLSFIPWALLAIDADQPFVLLAGSHIGCTDLVSRNRIRSTRELKGKTVAVPAVGDRAFISMFVAYVGLDPQKDINWKVIQPYGPDYMRLLAEGKIDAFMSGPPFSQELREKKIGHVLVNTTTDKPWSQYFCCMVVSTREFVRKYPVATKRALRAILKAADVCALQPNRVARLVADRGLTPPGSDYTLQMLKEIPFGKWREYSPEDTVRFYALWMREVGLIKSTPQKIIAQGTDWRFLNELKKELKG